MYQKLPSFRKGKFEPILESMYGQLFRAQMNKDWNEASRIQGIIGTIEERAGEMEEDREGLRDYERAVR